VELVVDLTACPHCGASLPLAVDAFCPECGNELSEPPVASLVVGDNPPAPVDIHRTGAPFGRIFGVLGMLAGIASGAVSLTRIYAKDQVVQHDPFYMIGYVTGSAAVSGLIGLVFGIILGFCVRSINRPKRSA
jgi:hypothetical protein